MLRRRSFLLLVVAGLASIGYLVAVTGVDALLAPIRTLSWRLVVVILLPYALVALLHTVGWRLLFHQVSVPLGRLFSVRLAGEALNVGTASVGGEAAKAYLLRPAVPVIEAAAGLVVEKTSIIAAQTLFLALGLAGALLFADLSSEFLGAMGVLLGIQIVAVGGFLLVQLVGVFDGTLRVLARLGLRGVVARVQGLVSLERALVASYGERPGRVVACTVVHLAGWMVGSLEVYLVLRWLDVGAGYADALLIEAFASGVRFMAFAIPGALGALEGGYMFAFAAVGLGSGLGLSFTLIHRLRLLVWTALGVLALALLRSHARGAAALSVARGDRLDADGARPLDLVEPLPVRRCCARDAAGARREVRR